MLYAFLSLCLLALPVFSASAQDWQKRSIYQLVTDRFATSDGSTPPCDTSKREYCNGTWLGITGKLDYIQNMGFDAIWISPIAANVEGTTGDGQAYHGYWTQDQNSLNPHFGTDDELQLLSTSLHERNMYLMVDVVVNDMAAFPLLSNSTPSSSAGPAVNYSAFSPSLFASASAFHPFCWITDYTNQTDVELCWMGDASVPLVDVNTEDAAVIDFFNSWIHALVQTYGADGLRIDAARNVRPGFWPNFTEAAGVWSIGEVLDGDVNYVGQYTQVLDAVLDYPTFYPLTAGFANSSGDLRKLASTVQAAQKTYRLSESMTGSFLENQDNPRFQSFQTDQALVMNAMTWPFVQDGVPILYYGQEQGYAGPNDPYNREALWLSDYNEQSPLVLHVRILNAARKAAIAANSNFLTTGLTFSSVSQNALAISKLPMLALLSNGGKTSTPSWSIADAGYSSGEELINVVTCDTMHADGSGGVSVQGADGMPQVILPTSAFNVSYCKWLLGDVTGNAGAIMSSEGERWGVKASVIPLVMTIFLVLVSWSAIA